MTRTTTDTCGTGRCDSGTETATATFVPRMDIWDSEREVVVYGDLPGVAAENLTIDFNDGRLSIHGTVLPRHEDVQLRHSEYRVGDFRRTFAVEGISADQITAELKNGVLTVRLPKTSRGRSRKIEVAAG